MRAGGQQFQGPSNCLWRHSVLSRIMKTEAKTPGMSSTLSRRPAAVVWRAILRSARLVGRTVEQCASDNTPMMAAGLAFYTLLSLAPALWVVVAFAGVVIGRESARAEIVQWTAQTIGLRAADLVGSLAVQVEENSSWATVLGVVSLFFGATLSFGALQDSLNRIWRLKSEDRGFLRGIVGGFFTRRLLAFGVVVAGGLLLLLSLLVAALITAIARFVPDFLPASPLLLESLNFTASLLLMMLLFTAVYRILHQGVFAWHDILVGAFVTALLFAIGKTLIGLYLGSTGVTSVYGAAGSLVLLLLWVYYSAQIFLFGAEFTEVYARSRRSPRQ